MFDQWKDSAELFVQKWFKKKKQNLGNITDQLQFETEIFDMSKPLSDNFQVDMSMIEAC